MNKHVKLFEDFGSTHPDNFELPPNHKPGMQVPKGGSCCANCEYWTGQECKNEYFIKWNGSGKIPAPPDEYCSDWYEPNEPNK